MARAVHGVTPMRSLSALLVLASVVAATACSSKEDPPASIQAEGVDGASGWKGAPAVSGSRLRARLLTAGDARELVGFHDSARNEDCTFRPAEPGHTRCLPTLAAGGVQGGTFSDAACTIPIATTATCDKDAKYGIIYKIGSGCGAPDGAEIRKVVGSAQTVYAQQGNGCAVLPASSLAPSAVSLGEVVPWTSFVEASEMVVEGDLIAEKVLVATDGARQHLSFRIQKFDADCTFQLMPDGVTRCVPEATMGPVLYTDSSCTHAAFVNDYQSQQTGPCSKPPAKLWLEPSIGTCAGARAVYSLSDYHGGDVGPSDSSELYGAQVTTSQVGGAAPTTTVTCTSMGSSGSSYPGRRGIDANITSSLPQATRVSTAQGRLVPALVSHSASAGGPLAAGLAVGWHDNEKDADCTFTLASDGKMRCLPTGGSAAIFFTDTQCKAASRVAVLGDAPCAGTGRFARVTSTTCPPTTRIFALGTEPKTLMNVSTETSPGRCPTVQGVTNALDATEVDPATFVEGVPVTE